MFNPIKRQPQTFDETASDRQRGLRAELYASAELAAKKARESIENDDAGTSNMWLVIADECRKLGFTLPLDLGK